LQERGFGGNTCLLIRRLITAAVQLTLHIIPLFDTSLYSRTIFDSTLNSISQTKHSGVSTPKRTLRFKGMNSASSSTAAPVSDDRALQRSGQVQAGGGGTLSLFYSSEVNSAPNMTAEASQSGTGSVMGMGFGTIRGPDGQATAGGSGGGNISGGFALKAYNGGFGNAIGGGVVGGFGAGIGQFIPGMNSQAGMQAAADEAANGTTAPAAPAAATPAASNAIFNIGAPTSTGGGGGALAFSYGLGAGNLTAPGNGTFVVGSASGGTTAFGMGFGIGMNSDGVAGGNGVSMTSGSGGGNAQAGTMPLANGTGQGTGGQTSFFGQGGGQAYNYGGGVFGNNPSLSVPAIGVPQISIPTLPAGAAGFFANP
jgi:hypothetical protein